MQFDENVKVALKSLLDHKLRSLLTMLGIIFGVAAVIAMLSIGEGAKRDALEKYKDLGVNNIIVRDKKLDDKELEEIRAKFSQGLSMSDANSIKAIIPGVVDVAPQSEKETDAYYSDRSGKATLIGITPSFQKILNYSVSRGNFISDDSYNRDLKVCVLGSSVAQKLFLLDDPIGKQIKIDDQWLEVIGILGSRSVFTETVGELASRDLNNDIYIPLTTFSKRFTKKSILESEVKQITINLSSSNNIGEIATIVRNLIDRHHFKNEDYDIIIPYQLLKEEEKERQRYNMLIASIAAISLLVGGIGIMNIMLATVMERTREIGVRRAIGAKQRNIIHQFLIEAVAISITGGLIGVFFGVTSSLMIGYFSDTKTLITFYSVIVAFLFSVVVGVSFGLFPARKAAQLSPIESIRHE
jgi:putative ABC transport system permease protein